ncbi:DUF418 domain-containing protein [Alteraurantiacibacter palmitatis]|uniref:DUF418 domain-containing protein n=1 Tax=Alteraurantiacibacter palmitatis TaxID=2054628 RepID=A0ABV7EAP8_9SPHN
MEPPSSPPATPVPTQERLVALDLMRGIGVLGILLANVTAFGHVDIAYYWPGALPNGGNAADRWIWLVQFVAVDGKFRGLFTLLFGASLLLFVERARQSAGGDSAAVKLQVRRLILLALIGLAHFALLFRGDILFTYACGGLGALLFLRLPAERLLAIGLIWAVVGAGVQALAFLTPAMVEAGLSAAPPHVVEYYASFWQAQLEEASAQAAVLGQGSYADVLDYRLTEEAGLVAYYAQLALYETIPLILIGLALFRGHVMGRQADDGSVMLISRPAAVGLALAGLIANLAAGLWVMGQGFTPYVTQLAFFGLGPLANIPLLLGGAVLLARWAARPHTGWLAARLVLAGRMALSNYVGTSLVMMLVFQGWAGGLFGSLHRAELLLVVLLGWALMLTFSRVWLGRFRQGPLEWIWRCATYRRMFANRLPR